MVKLRREERVSEGERSQICHINGAARFIALALPNTSNSFRFGYTSFVTGIPIVCVNMEGNVLLYLLYYSILICTKLLFQKLSYSLTCLIRRYNEEIRQYIRKHL